MTPGRPGTRPDLRIGLEVCLEDPPAVLRGARFGLLLNQASVDAKFRYSHQLLAARFPSQLKALFGPQHGLWSEQQDDMVETPHSFDRRLGVPVHSLYSARRRPIPEMLEGLELLVVDLQDVGARVYTYVWTVSHCLEACAEAGVPVLVLDRPNPLGGEVVEGPSLDPEFASFVGRAPIPMRHGLTLAELAAFVNDAMAIGCELHSVPMRGWRRELLWSDLGRAWAPTSPNLPRFEGVLVYPGQVLLEGTGLSEGRGTTTPFELCGAPWLDGWAWREELLAFGPDAAPGLALRPVRFEPTFHKFQGRSCGGLFLHPTEPRAVRPYRTTVALLACARRMALEEFGFKEPPYEYETERMPIDVISGSDRLRTRLERGLAPADLDALCAVDGAAWAESTAPHRLYPC